MDFPRQLKQEGHRVFLDLKLYDIGETVRRAVANIAPSGIDFLTIHGMRQVMESGVAGRGDAALKLLAVSVLTSVDQDDLLADGYSCTLPELIDLRVRNAAKYGADGIVCAATDVEKVRAASGPLGQFRWFPECVRRASRRSKAGRDPSRSHRRRRRLSRSRTPGNARQ